MYTCTEVGAQLRLFINLATATGPPLRVPAANVVHFIDLLLILKMQSLGSYCSYCLTACCWKCRNNSHSVRIMRHAIIDITTLSNFLNPQEAQHKLRSWYFTNLTPVGLLRFGRIGKKIQFGEFKIPSVTPRWDLKFRQIIR